MIKRSAKSQRYHFYLRQLQSPTQFNLSRYLLQRGWCRAFFNWRVDFGEQHLQFDLTAAQHLEFKHLLAQLVARCNSQIMPVTYCINDQNYLSVLYDLESEYYTFNQQRVDEVSNLAWILKPALLNNGQHIKIYYRLSDLKKHFFSSNRLGGEHVLQHYIARPHLLNGHKYSIRMFVIMTNYAGAYLYRHGYFNVAKQAYQPFEFADLRPHLTNEHLSADEANVIQIPSQRCDFFAPIYQQIHTLASATFNALQLLQPQAFVCPNNESRVLGFFGYDFMVDADSRVWLLEVNHGPCFPVSDEHVLQKYLYYDFWQAVIDSFVLPIAQRLDITEIKCDHFDKL